MSKYHAIRTNGYASKAEDRHASELKMLERAGKISGLVEQPRFTLLPAGGGYKRPLEYVGDFAYWEPSQAMGRYVVADVKGFKTPVYKLKKRLMAQLLGIEITEV